MSWLLRRYRQIRLCIQTSPLWAFATRTTFRLVISSLVVFTAALLMMVASVFLVIWSKVLGFLACAAFVALLAILNILADEGRRREKRR